MVINEGIDHLVEIAAEINIIMIHITPEVGLIIVIIMMGTVTGLVKETGPETIIITLKVIGPNLGKGIIMRRNMSHLEAMRTSIDRDQVIAEIVHQKGERGLLQDITVTTFMQI